MIFLYWYRDLKAQAERIVEVRALEKIKFLQLLINRQTLWMYRNILTEKCITIDLIKYETNNVKHATTIENPKTNMHYEI